MDSKTGHGATSKGLGDFCKYLPTLLDCGGRDTGERETGTSFRTTGTDTVDWGPGN